MKVLMLDPYEFGNSGSQEFLVIAIARSLQYQDRCEFFAATVRENCFALDGTPQWHKPIYFKHYAYAATTKDYLATFIGWTPDSDAIVFPVNEDWDEQDAIIEEAGTYLRYYWQTYA